MQTGRVEANLAVLNQHFRLSYIPDLIVRKTGGAEDSTLDSHLPNEPTGRDELNELLIRLRLM